MGVPQEDELGFLMGFDEDATYHVDRNVDQHAAVPPDDELDGPYPVQP